MELLLNSTTFSVAIKNRAAGSVKNSKRGCASGTSPFFSMKANDDQYLKKYYPLKLRLLSGV